MYTAIIAHVTATIQCSLTPITEALWNIPKNPFFSDRKKFFSLGTLFIYAHVHITRREKTTIPSNE